jgi:trans-aconitate 2-methyltransferase
MPSWDPNLYLQFGSERTQPSLDLIARISVANPTRIIDLGCGPGNSTEVLRRRWPEADVTGLDSSPEMIAAARKTYPEGKWVLADAGTWVADAPYDIVYSNAALQWIPDHARLFPHLLYQVAAGGALAVQVPAHYHSPLNQVMREAARDAEWVERMQGPLNALTRESPAFYYDVLQPAATRVEIWETEYQHVMEGPQAIVDWFRGTGMRPFLDALETEAERQRFEQLVRAGYTKAYPTRIDGRILFPFRRLFMVAYR